MYAAIKASVKMSQWSIHQIKLVEFKICLLDDKDI